MAFHNTLFPTDISAGSSGGPGFRTIITELDSGAEKRISRWAQPRHQYDISKAVKTFEQLGELKRFYMARQGAAYSFRYKDWLDYNSTPAGIPAVLGGTDPAFTDVEIGVGDGNTTVFQLLKKYTEGGVTRTRVISKPVLSTVKIGIDGVEQTSGWAIDATTGVVTFTSAPASTLSVTAGFEFDVHCRFGQSSDDLFDASMDDFNVGSIRCELIEVVDDGAHPDEYNFGGSFFATLTSDLTLSANLGKILCLDPNGANRDLNLFVPEYRTHPAGGPYFVIYNNGSSYTLDAREPGGSSIATVYPGNTGYVFLHIDSTSYQWLGAE